MPGKTRKFVRVTKFLLAGVSVFCVSWIACVSEWHPGVRWRSRGGQHSPRPATIRTIVAYSEGKQAELERPSPVACDTLPAFPHLPHINRSWSPGVTQQSWQPVAGTRVSLFAAYYDKRTPQRYVRILATFHGRNFSSEDTLFCQTRSLSPNEDSVEVVAARPLEIWWHKWDATPSEVDTPLLLSCPLTEPLFNPSVVSVVTQPCDNPTNAFPLNPTQNRNKHKRNFTVCVKDMNFDKDISQNLMEWIETNNILGVDLIDMYVGKVSRETEDTLQHYRDKGFVRLFNVPIMNKQDRSLWQRRRDHIITYNDCLYRNIEESEFIIPLDVDEIILPKVAKTLPELINRLESYGWNSSENSAIMIRNLFFFDFMQGVNKEEKLVDIIEVVHNFSDLNNEVIDVNDTIKSYHKTVCGAVVPVPKLAKNIVSSAIVSPIGFYAKSLMVTKKVLTAFNHYPLASFGTADLSRWPAPFSEVQLNHYKESCNVTVLAECKRYARRTRIDTSALRFHHRLLSALADTLCSRCGKTQIANFISESMNIEEAGAPTPTQGVRIVEFELSNLNVNGKSNNVDIELWDCSGDHKFESCWPALRVGVQGVILVCSPNTLQAATREMELLYNYFVSQSKLSAKQCVLFYNCTDSDEHDDMDSLTLSPTFSKVSRVAINLKSGGNRLKIDFSNYVTSVLQSINKDN